MSKEREVLEEVVSNIYIAEVGTSGVVNEIIEGLKVRGYVIVFDPEAAAKAE